MKIWQILPYFSIRTNFSQHVGAKKWSLLRSGLSREGLCRGEPLYVHVCGWVGEEGKDYSVFVIKTV